MTHSLFSQLIGIAAVLASSMAMAQERSIVGYESTYDLQFCTYFGGSGGELLRDMTVDAQGNIYVAGIAGAADFPRTPPELSLIHI